MPTAGLDVVERDPRRAVVVLTRYDEKDLIKQVPGSRWDADVKGWRLPLSWGTCLALRGVFGASLTVDETLQEWAWEERRDRIDSALRLRDLVEWPKEWAREGGPESDMTLYPFQQVGAHFIWNATQVQQDNIGVAGGVILGDEMGTGKTVQTYAALNYLLLNPLPAVIICPNSVKGHWARLAERWLPRATPYVVGGGAAGRRKALGEAAQDPSALVIMHYEVVRLHSRLAPYGSIRLARCLECDPQFGDETLTPARCEVHPKELNDFGFQTVVLDEGHRIIDPRAKQTRACWAVAHDDSVKRTILLTGTPISKATDDIWSLLHCAAPLDFPTKTKFIDRYCLTSWNSFGALQVVGLRPDTRDEFFGIVNPRYRRMPKALVLPQLPPRIREIPPRYVEMGREQRRMYEEMEAGLVTFTEDGEPLIASSNLVAATRLLQIASSSVDVEVVDPDDVRTWRVTPKEPSPKLDELEAILGEIGDEQFCVSFEHRKLLELAAARFDRLGVRYGVISGAVPQPDRDRAIAGLHNGSLQAILYTKKAGGVGIDLSPARVLVNVQRSWALIDEIQSEARNHRIGSERHDSVLIIDIVTRGTIEEKQIARLLVKMQRLEEINQDKARLLAAGVDITDLEAEEAKLMREYLGAPQGDFTFEVEENGVRKPVDIAPEQRGMADAIADIMDQHGVTGVVWTDDQEAV